MNIIELSTGNTFPIEIIPVQKADFKSITKKRYFFDWKAERGHELYKLVIQGDHEILGLISLERIPQEWRIHIRLLTVSIENKGVSKKYDKIIGNLLSFASKIAVKEYGACACISLVPKTSIAHHYIKKYKMNLTGKTVSLEVPEILNLINQYDQ